MSENGAWVSEALDHLDPALLEALEGADGTKVRHPVPVRVLLAAACICGALVIGTVAAEALGFDFVKIFQGEEKPIVYVNLKDYGSGERVEASTLYEVDGSGLSNIPLRELSPAIREIQEQYKDEDWHTENVGFDSWAEAEEFLGRELADNAVLDRMEYGKRFVEPKEDWQRKACSVGAFIRYGEISSVDVVAEYLMPISQGGTSVSTGISVRADLYIGEELPFYPTFGFMDTGYWAAEGQEGYLTANGLETVIISLKQVRDGNVTQRGEYHAFFFLRGVRFRVETNYWGPEEQETVLAGLKQVLDAFE